MKKLMYFSFISFLMITIGGCKDEKEILIDPELIVSIHDMDFKDGATTQSFSISTKPASECEYKIEGIPDWVEVSPTSGVIMNNIETIQVSSTLNESNVPGEYSGELKIISTSGTKTVNLKGSVGEYFSYSPLPDTVKVSELSTNSIFSIINSGNIAIDYNTTISNNYISLSQTSGNIQVDGEENIIININRESLVTGSYESKIFLNLNNKKDTIVVKIENFKEQKTILKAEITDAEFSKTSNKMVYVSSNPMALFIYDVATKKHDQLNLSFIPTSVSVSSNGNYAIVGHDGKASYIDLIAKKVLKTIDVPCYIFDIALGDNDWAYASPREDQWSHVICIDIKNNSTVNHEGYFINAGSKIKMHPSGKYIYLADNYISPSDLDKMDIQNGRAIYLYDSPYHGDYPVSGDLWFSEDGSRIFTRSGCVFKASTDKSIDMTYNGRINTDQSQYGLRIQWIDHSDSKNNLYIVTSDSYSNQKSTFVYIHNDENLLLRNKIELERYLVSDNSGNGTFYPAIPHFVFSNKAGNMICVLTQAAGSGLKYEWALQEYNIE